MQDKNKQLKNLYKQFEILEDTEMIRLKINRHLENEKYLFHKQIVMNYNKNKETIKRIFNNTCNKIKGFENVKDEVSLEKFIEGYYFKTGINLYNKLQNALRELETQYIWSKLWLKNYYEKKGSDRK